jgi:hypothetical protein
MATNINEHMVTRHNRLDYFILNDGSDDEALPEDRMSETAQSEVNSSTNRMNSLKWQQLLEII